LAGSIHWVLPASLLYTPQDLVSAAGGLPAAIAIGAFFGQVRAIGKSSTEEDRRRKVALGGLAGAVVLIGLFLVSINGS
jgi:hypothetical protein